MVLMVLAVRRNSPVSRRPSISRAMVWLRSPLATAPMTRATSVVGWTRSTMRLLTASMQSPQDPLTPSNEARWEVFPSLPTTLLMRRTSLVSWACCSITSFSASAILPGIPV
ncbi:hypothetical protein BH20PSE1_BH20PSE1_04410 [soil metagenome]